MNRTEILQDAVSYALDQLEGIQPDSVYGCDLHHELFNMDYYIIGTFEAKKWLDGIGTFEAINTIKEYEQDNFGQVSTDLSDPEKVANMLMYIKGEEVLAEIEHLQEVWDNYLTQDDLDTIQKELEELSS